ncbi:hypothetical protein AAEU76_004976 [Salmonella enterica subsp. enterica serovar Wedding]
MKTPAFTVTGVMACLLLLSQPVNAQTTASATFNLKAELQAPTCNHSLASSGDADSAGNVDFGTISSAEGGNAEETKHVVLTLNCDSSYPPSVTGIGFSILTGNADSGTAGRLYPTGPDNSTGNTNLYYNWAWGQKINDTVMKNPGDGYVGLSPGQPVGLSDNAGFQRYRLVPSKERQEWAFPLDITREVKNIANVTAGDYSAAVRVNIAYQ